MQFIWRCKGGARLKHLKAWMPCIIQQAPDIVYAEIGSMQSQQRQSSLSFNLRAVRPMDRLLRITTDSLPVHTS